MRPLCPTAGVPATALVLISLLHAGCAPRAQTAPEDPAHRAEDRRLVGATSRAHKPGGKPEGKALSASVPGRDARGEPVPGLPRPPGSARTGYSEKEAHGLVLVRATYLSPEGPDAVRGFYRGVFRAEGWEVANVEYSGGRWHFLVLRRGHEAEVEVGPRGGGSEVRIELSRPPRTAGDVQGCPAPAGGSKR